MPSPRSHRSIPDITLFAALFALVALTHLTLLRLPYYWDEGGYYIPAALDFYHRWTLIPEFTNAHPPLPNVVLGLLWHVFGYHIVVTRLVACAFAAAGLAAVFKLAQRLLDTTAALIVTGLTLVYPIWFAQSSLAHADIFAAAFTLGAFVLCFTTPANDRRANLWIAALFTLSVLSKETAIVQPAVLAAIELGLLAFSKPRRSWQRLAALSFPLLPLLAWYAYHHHKTGFTFGNPEYLRYNATANLTAAHIQQSLYYRFLHLAWQRNIWLPILLALACLLLPRRKDVRGLTRNTRLIFGALIFANWIAFSVLGGALLTRYLLPIYPLILLLCVDTWRTRTRYWIALTGASAVLLIAGLWLNPPTSFAPEDTLVYRDMIVVHQQAINFVADHYPDATVLTAWPVAADIFRPDLGYVTTPMKVVSIDSFDAADVRKAATEPGNYDTAIVFTQKYTSPALLDYLYAHRNTQRFRDFDRDRELTAEEIAGILGGQIVYKASRNGEWAAVLRFHRSYQASLSPGADTLLTHLR